MALSNPALAAVVEAAVPQHTRSKQQADAFREGAAVIEKYLAEAGLADTIMPSVRREVAAVEGLLRRAAQTEQTLQAALDPGSLDERARSVIALTASLKKILGPPTSQGYGSTRASDDVEKGVIRAISFIVWAYLTNGQVAPAVLTSENGS